MNFAWTSATLAAFVVGILVGGLLEYYFPTGHKNKNKAKTETSTKLCPHCGESLETKN